MKKEETNKEVLNRILDCFIDSLTKSGFKATTMDSLASTLQMSKRTLYELFSNKEEIFREACIYYHKKIANDLSDIFASSTNVMDAIIRCCMYNRDLMSNLSSEFLKDMEEYSKKMVKDEAKREMRFRNLYDVLKRGVEEGYFRHDINLKVQCRMLSIQMEALKHTETLFPADITLLDVYDSIIIGFLRGISNNKGLEALEKYMPLFTKKDTDKNL